MFLNKKIYISLLLSFLIHFAFVIQLLDNKIENQEIYVLNLSNYQKVEFEKKVQQERVEEKIIDEKVIKEEPKEEPKQKKVEKIDKKKLSIKLTPKNKFVDQKKIKPKQIEKKFKPEKIVEEELNITDSQIKPSMQIESKQKILVDELLSEYLRKISMQINNIAIRSYPIQSIKRREQGTIKTIIILNEKGKVLELTFLDKKPKRLYKATKKIIQSFKFPAPSKEILSTNNTLKIKIPVNFIIR